MLFVNQDVSGHPKENHDLGVGTHPRGRLQRALSERIAMFEEFAMMFIRTSNGMSGAGAGQYSEQPRMGCQL